MNKSPIPVRNWVLFIFASILIMVAWTYFDYKNRPVQLSTQQKNQVVETLQPLLSLAPSGGGLSDAWTYAGSEMSHHVPADVAEKVLAQVEAKRKEEANR